MFCENKTKAKGLGCQRKSNLKQPLKKNGMITNEITKSLPVNKRMVWEAYKLVKSNRGSAGVDGETIEKFDENLSKNLYKIWNRMSSGSYFPPSVRTVFIPKKQGGTRPLGIPTVSDRIAQTVVKQYLEKSVDAKFHGSSFGYRPGKSAHDAVKQCEQNCWKYDWVIDLDIKGFFDNLNHELLLTLVKKHTSEKWVLMYIQRWLKAGVEQQNGSIQARQKGTPQGGSISTLLANIYLHHAFDLWMQEKYPQLAFERYADDSVVHCRSKQQAEELLKEIRERLHQFKLELNSEKTRIVYCKDYRRKEEQENRSFDFLGFTLQPRLLMAKNRNRFLGYKAGISQKAKQSIRTTIKGVIHSGKSCRSIEWYAQCLNAKLRGWINYYGAFMKQETLNVMQYVNLLLCKWIKSIYRLSIGQAYYKLHEIQAVSPNLFYH